MVTIVLYFGQESVVFIERNSQRGGVEVGEYLTEPDRQTVARLEEQRGARRLRSSGLRALAGAASSRLPDTFAMTTCS